MFLIQASRATPPTTKLPAPSTHVNRDRRKDDYQATWVSLDESMDKDQVRFAGIGMSLWLRPTDAPRGEVTRSVRPRERGSLVKIVYAGCLASSQASLARPDFNMTSLYQLH